MSIQVEEQEGEVILSSFAEMVGSKIQNGKVNIPAKYGDGYVLGFTFESYMRLIVRHYQLKDELVIRRHKDHFYDKMVMISLQNILNDNGLIANTKNRSGLPSATISTKGLEEEINIPAYTQFNAINLAVDANFLKKSLGSDADNTILQGILENSQPYIFEQVVSSEIQQIAAEIIQANVAVPLQKMFYRIKAEELICYLLLELLKRENNTLQAINAADINALFATKSRLIDNLAKAPCINVLAAYAGMSESKLKRLFKQVFGKSIYQYFQAVRMKEAACLLKEAKLAVSEVGYQLGFSNLSHFARVFKEHTGITPKKFSALI